MKWSLNVPNDTIHLKTKLKLLKFPKVRPEPLIKFLNDTVSNSSHWEVRKQSTTFIWRTREWLLNKLSSTMQSLKCIASQLFFNIVDKNYTSCSKAMMNYLHNCCGSQIFIAIPPVRRTGSGTASAQNTFVKSVLK